MAQILDDSSVIPSYLGFQARGGHEDSGIQSNLSLRHGEVRKIIYPTDPDSVSGRFIEYNVEVQQRDGSSTGVAVTYANCLLSNLFGGAADVFKYTLREDNQKQPPTDGVGVGSKVVLLCLNGITTKAVIIGGLRETGPIDPDGTGRNGNDQESDGHNLYFEFNGANVKIDDAGEIQIMYRGKTQADGSLDSSANPDAEGTSVLFNKDGSLKLFTPKQDQSIFLDHANKKMFQIADAEWNVNVTSGPLNFSVASDINMNGGAGMSVGVSRFVDIQSSGVHVGASTDFWIKGTTYRIGETLMNTQLIAAFTAIATQIGVAGGALSAAGAIPVWPVAMVSVAAAGAALASCAAPLAVIISAITEFEAASATYLSLKNLTD